MCVYLYIYVCAYAIDRQPGDLILSNFLCMLSFVNTYMYFFTNPVLVRLTTMNQA